METRPVRRQGGLDVVRVPEVQAAAMTGSHLPAIARNLRDAVSGLSFAPPVTHVYNPLEYAWEPHEE